jgi:hypothetical protein
VTCRDALTIVLVVPRSIVQPKILRKSRVAVASNAPRPHHSRFNPITLPPIRMASCPRLWVFPETVAAFSP